MQKNRQTKLTKNTSKNSLHKNQKSNQKVNRNFNLTIKPNLSNNNIKINNTININRNIVRTPKKSQFTHRTIKSNLSQNHLKLDTVYGNKITINQKYKNNVTNPNNTINNNSHQKIIPKDKMPMPKVPIKKPIKPKVNIILPKKEEIKNTKILSSGASETRKITKNIENKKEEKDKKFVYNRKKVEKGNNFVSKRSDEKKLAEMEQMKKDKELESFPTFKKIVILQNLLKEMHSIKERFKDNIEKMKEEIYSKCYYYFNNKVYMKEIFDYCISRKPEEHRDYQLVSDIKEYLNHDVYQILYNFFFLIRNNNDLILKIINLSDKFVYEELSDFFVNFLYENIINSSFIQKELILVIYLLIDEQFLKIPDNINENDNIYIKYIKNNFLFFVFKSLTRKIDVRNFLCSILNDIILRMESFRVSLSTDINIVNRFLRNREGNGHHSFIKFTKGDNEDMKIKKSKKNFRKRFKADISYRQGTDGGSAFLKRTKKIQIGDSNVFHNKDSDWILIHSKLSQSKTLNDSSVNNSLNNINNKEINDDTNTLNKSRTNINEEIEKSIDEKSSKEKKYIKNSIDIDKFLSKDSSVNLKTEGEEEKIEIDPFFENNSVTTKFLSNKLLEFRKSLNKNTINFAMKDYINSLIYQLQSNEQNLKEKNSIDSNLFKIDSNDYFYKNSRSNKDKENDKEIFSTSLIIEELESIREIKQIDSFKLLMKKIKINHKIVTKIITNIINKIKDNLISIPFILKYILKLLNILLEKKYSRRSRNKLSYYNIYMYKINFFIGNIILPILRNPEYNGIITTDVISQMTNENLKIISDIFEKIICGELFNKNKEPYMTLFNQFIIEIMPQLFELVEDLEIIEKNFEIPRNIKKLIDEKNYKKIERNINYDYFKENPNEYIEYQSICFSWQNLYMLLQIITTNKKIFIDENQNNEQKIIFEKVIENKDKFINLFMNGLKNKKSEFLLLTKLNYKNELEQQLSPIISDNFDLIIPKFKNDLITAYKKCMTEVLCYVNIIHKEYFLSFTLRNDENIYDRDIIKIIDKTKRNNTYGKIVNNNSNIQNSINKSLSLRNISLTGNDKDDIDFKEEIFPQILNIIQSEISFNLDSPISQRIIFCCNYLKLYMRNIPNKYKLNNFGLLFIELIKENQKNIEYLKSNALFEYYLKIKDAEKLNFMLSNYNSQIRNLEKQKCIEYLYYKLLLPINLKIEKDDKGIITNIEYKKPNNQNNLNINKEIDIIDYLKNRNQPIKNFLDEFPDFHEYEDEFDNILDIQEKANAPDAINNYFNELKNLIKKEKIINRFNKEELESIIYDLENYILTKLYDKIFPSESTKDDIFFYKKCVRLSFIKPENVVSDKKLINESLMEKAIEYINDIDDKLTPVDKIKTIAKAIEIVTNSINFSSGKDELGVDDVIKPLVYIMIKSRPKNISSNYQYCELYINSELGKKQYGVILAQIGLVIGVIKNMKYNDLIGVTEKEFGIDEIEEDNDESDKEG